MIVLGADMSGHQGTIGLLKEGKFLGETSVNMKMKHLPNFLPVLDFLLKRSGLEMKDIDLFVTVTGPGSWTGIRIGVTMIKSMAHTLNKPAVGICSLDALANNYNFTNKTVYPIIDGARGQVYFAEYDCKGEYPHRTSDYFLKKVENFLVDIKKPAIVLGDACVKYNDKIKKNPEIYIAPINLNRIGGAIIVEAGLKKFIESGSDDVLEMEPLYLQKSDAERKFEEKNGKKIL